MDNPTGYLKRYMERCHPKLEISSVLHDSREGFVFCWANVKLKSGHWDFRIMIPRAAPEDGRPLCTMVKRDGVPVWQFEKDHKFFQGLRQKFRVHLHELSVDTSRQYALVEVLEGTPDRITRVLRMDGDEFSLEVEALFKINVGRLWGMKVHTNADEKKALTRLLQPQNKNTQQPE